MSGDIRNREEARERAVVDYVFQAIDETEDQ